MPWGRTNRGSTVRGRSQRVQASRIRAARQRGGNAHVPKRNPSGLFGWLFGSGKKNKK